MKTQLFLGVLLLICLAYPIILGHQNTQPIRGGTGIIAGGMLVQSFRSIGNLTISQQQNNCLLVSKKNGFICSSTLSKTELRTAQRQILTDERNAQMELMREQVRNARIAYNIAHPNKQVVVG